MFLRIPFPLQFWVVMEHKSCSMGNLEDRKVKKPYSYYTQQVRVGKGFCDLSHMWLSAGFPGCSKWGRRGWQQATPGFTATLPISSFSFLNSCEPGTYQESWQSVAVSPVGDTYNIRDGGLKVAGDQPRFQFTLVGPIQVPICPFSPPCLSNCLTWGSYDNFP